jgi:hypothetical protein
VGSVGIGSAAVRVDVCGSDGPFVLGLFNAPVPQQNCNTLERSWMSAGKRRADVYFCRVARLH